MEATPDVYRVDIAHTRDHIARIDAMLPSRDGYFAWDQAQARRVRLVQQLANLERALARAEAAYVGCPDCGAGMRRTHTGGGKRRQAAWICARAEAEVSTDERGHQHRAPDAVHSYTRVWTRDELAD